MRALPWRQGERTINQIAINNGSQIYACTSRRRDCYIWPYLWTCIYVYIYITLLIKTSIRLSSARHKQIQTVQNTTQNLAHDQSRITSNRALDLTTKIGPFWTELVCMIARHRPVQANRFRRDVLWSRSPKKTFWVSVSILKVNIPKANGDFHSEACSERNSYRQNENHRV